MRNPRFTDGRAFDWTMSGSDRWFIVFPTVDARKLCKQFRKLSIASVGAIGNAFGPVTTNYVRNYGWSQGFKFRERESLPRVGDKVTVWMDDESFSYGAIIDRVWEDREVCIGYEVYGRYEAVIYHDDELSGRWTDKFGGTYIVEEK